MDFLVQQRLRLAQAGRFLAEVPGSFLRAFVLIGMYFLLKCKKVLPEEISTGFGAFSDNNSILQQNTFITGGKSCTCDVCHFFMDLMPFTVHHVTDILLKM